MSELYVCKQYETPFERVCKIIEPLEEHDKQVMNSCLAVYKSQLINHIKELETYVDYVQPDEIKFVRVDDVLRLLK